MLNNIAVKRFFISLTLIAVFVYWTLSNLDFASQLFQQIQSQISNSLGWLIIFAANCFVIFSAYLVFSRFSHIKIGGQSAEPEFSYASWTAMLFSAGLGIGLLFYGVAEPIFHLDSIPMGGAESSIADKANRSMNFTFLHWGIHGWSVYAVVGLCFGISSYNLKKPFRVSAMIDSRFTSHSFGRISIDVLAILATIFGIATSLGLGATQISSGLDYLNVIDQTFTSKILIIVVITILGLISVMLGLNSGIKRLSEINILLCMVLILAVFIFGPSSFILNGIIQNVGSYLQNFISLATWTEAYSSTSWQNDWTLFYYTWWFAWSPFVGLFIARVSYGRSIKEFILGVVLVPSLMVFIWMGTFGNAAIYQELFTDINLSEAINQDISIALFSFLEQFPFSKILMGLSIVIILTFFVTSSDSGALVSAMLSSSSDTDFDEDPPMLARIVWAISLGILAVALLAGGGLSALQTSVLVTGAPFAIIIAIAAKNLLARLENLK
jgi:choline/glycine/proline betaine transport protein